MEIATGIKVKINPSIATKEYLLNCHFDVSIPEKLEDISKGREYLVTGVNFTETTRDGKVHHCVRLESFGWIPKEAISCGVHDFLKIGYAYKTREGKIYLCAERKGLNLNTLVTGESYNRYRSDGTHTMYKSLDIVGVYRIQNNCTIKNIFDTIPIWTETTPAREMTVAEIEKELGHGVKVVGEDGDEYSF
jgi:hypothetical protein